MSREFYVMDRRTRTIINCITSATRIGAERALANFEDSEHLYLIENPPLAALQEYRYWNERP